MGLFDWMLRSKAVGEFLTQGPPEDEHPPVGWGEIDSANNTWHAVNGWFPIAERRDAHPGRVGPLIVPKCVVVHTTDMLPKSFAGLVKGWQASAGVGAAAHFILGRDKSQGLVQLVPITRNANHAGGPTVNGRPIHGWWVTKAGAQVHPNTVSVGIEVHGAGALSWKKGATGVAQYIEDKKVLGEFTTAAGEVYVDELGRPWHVITDYQLELLEHLLMSLQQSLQYAPELEPRADAAFVKDRSRWDTSYAVPYSNHLVGHVSLDPINKTDPGPQLMKFINELAEKRGWK